MKRLTLSLIAITLLSAVSACSTGSNPGLPVSHDLGPVTEQPTDNVKVTLEAPVWLWDERIRYRLLYQDPTVIRYYHRDRWEAPLPALLEHRLTVNSEQPLTVQIQLRQFEQQFVTLNQARVVMSLAVSVFTAKDYRLIARRSFNLSQNTVSADAAGTIAGFIILNEQVDASIQAWVGTLFDKRRES